MLLLALEYILRQIIVNLAELLSSEQLLQTIVDL
jgi:hypothetical protein